MSRAADPPPWAKAAGDATAAVAMPAVAPAAAASRRRREGPAEAAVLAVGHSARSTYRWLADTGVPMARKDLAVGVRIEHRGQSRRSRRGPKSCLRTSGMLES